MDYRKWWSNADNSHHRLRKAYISRTRRSEASQAETLSRIHLDDFKDSMASNSNQPVSSRNQNLGYAVATPKKVLPAADRAQKMADALNKAALDDDLPEKSKKKKDASTLAAMIRRSK